MNELLIKNSVRGYLTFSRVNYHSVVCLLVKVTYITNFNTFFLMPSSCFRLCIMGVLIYSKPYSI